MAERHDRTGPTWPARLPLTIGVFAMVMLVGGVGGWSVGTTLSGAVIASASVKVESNRQVIQHPDGGVVRDIMVRDGDRVDAGDVLLRLDGRRLQSELTIAEGRLRGLAARRARLIAERSDAEQVIFPPDLVERAATDPETRGLIEGEATLFAARLEALQQQSGLLDEQNEQIASRIEGIDDIAMSTNGVLLPRYARDLREAGLERITVSLDSVDPEAFLTMSGGRGSLAEVMA
ncbi:MAG: radical SAM protein, partial [Pseudomonadota bacterium]